MAEIEDIEYQLLKLLEENWDADTKEQTTFSRNLRRMDTALAEPHVIVHEVAEAADWSNEDTGDCRAVIGIQVRLSVEAMNTEKVEEAKSLKHEIRKEIYQILHKMDSGAIDKPTGWEWGYVTRRNNLDNFDAPTPMLGEELQVTIAFERNLNE